MPGSVVLHDVLVMLFLPLAVLDASRGRIWAVGLGITARPGLGVPYIEVIVAPIHERAILMLAGKDCIPDATAQNPFFGRDTGVLTDLASD